MKNTHRGMALIEVLVSLLLFSFGVLGLIGLEARSVNFSVDAEDRNRAALIANEITSVADPKLGGLPNGLLTITPVAGTTNSADIALSWKPPSRTATDDRSTFTTRVILP
jgi:type IV pilus assembly protein PilV